ncbi:MAG: monovalent cation/H(+) antiporter subunit G [Phycisphaerae bacterium]
MNEVAAQILIAVGLAFDLFGCLGLVRLPDVYNRVQAATKCVTLGTCLILGGTALYGMTGPMTIKALLCAVFLLLTSPVAAHAIARGAYRSGVRLWEGSVIDRYGEEVHPAGPPAERTEPAGRPEETVAAAREPHE